jgi:hypothetical protein
MVDCISIFHLFFSPSDRGCSACASATECPGRAVYEFAGGNCRHSVRWGMPWARDTKAPLTLRWWTKRKGVSRSWEQWVETSSSPTKRTWCSSRSHRTIASVMKRECNSLFLDQKSRSDGRRSPDYCERNETWMKPSLAQQDGADVRRRVLWSLWMQ